MNYRYNERLGMILDDSERPPGPPTQAEVSAALQCAMDWEAEFEGIPKLRTQQQGRGSKVRKRVGRDA